MSDLFGDPAAFLQRLILQVPALLVAVTVHELAHALVADRLGDSTARLQGRITLNPLPHLDPLGALAFVLAGFGWAKPVPVNPHNFRRPRLDMALVGAAGPLANFAAALVALIGFRLARLFVHEPFLAAPTAGVLQYLYVFNLGLGIFNLIPLPPLDGGHFLPFLLPGRSLGFLRQIEQIGPLLLIGLIISGATRYIVGPAFELISSLLVAFVRLIL